MNIIIFGTGDCAQLAKMYLDKDSIHTPVAFCENEEYIKNTHVSDLPVYSFESITDYFCKTEFSFFAPIYDNKLREQKANEIKEKGYDLITYISSKATCWSEDVGENTFIMEDNTIQPFVKIGDNVIMWSGNHIGHHSTIENNVFFSSHVVLSGHCVVKQYSWLGVNSAIKDHIILEEGTFVAMSASVIKSTKAWTTYIGIPAKPYKESK
jgi:sugar O-acyltransferase (sialic acid O-acetyltransferase NeuD family)